MYNVDSRHSLTTVKNNYFSYSEQDMEALVSLHYQRLVNYIQNMISTGGSLEAEDILHDVLIRFYENRIPILTDRVPTYLFRAVKNACLNYNTRSCGKQIHLDVDAWNVVYETVYEVERCTNPMENIDVAQIRAFSDSLPSRTREVFLKSRIENMKQEDIAKEMGISLRAVQKHITLSIRRCRKYFNV